MKKGLRRFTLLLTVMMLVSLLAACGGSNNNSPGSTNSDSSANTGGSSGNGGGELEKDTITALLPPVSANYQARFSDMEKEFNELYPHLTLKIEPASWEDMT
ncbi:hypothetical protein [Paenibacillus campinasensis]